MPEPVRFDEAAREQLAASPEVRWLKERFGFARMGGWRTAGGLGMRGGRFGGVEW